MKHILSNKSISHYKPHIKWITSGLIYLCFTINPDQFLNISTITVAVYGTKAAHTLHSDTADIMVFKLLAHKQCFILFKMHHVCVPAPLSVELYVNTAENVSHCVSALCCDKAFQSNNQCVKV